MMGAGKVMGMWRGGRASSGCRGYVSHECLFEFELGSKLCDGGAASWDDVV